jgi:glycosyltransferase involved in cell wall biosynthesis
MRRVLYLRSELLPLTETFIAAQAAALRRYEPGFAGQRRICGLDLPTVIGTVSDGSGTGGRLMRDLHRRFGRSQRLHAAVQDWQPDLLHAHFATDAACFLPLARTMNVPLMVTLHGYDVGCTDAAHARVRSGRLFLQRREELFARAGVFLCVSQRLRQVAVERGFPPAKLRVHRTGVPISPEATGSRERTVLFAGRLIEKKGCRLLLEAMRQVASVAPDAQLTIAGDGPLRVDLERYAAEQHLRCRFLGALSHASIREQMRRAAMLVVPSVSASNGDCEGLPTVILEAMESGLPVVAFQGSGAEEAVSHGETGYLVPARDVDALGTAIAELLANPERARSMGRRGRARAEAEFDILNQTQRLEAIYDEWVSGHAN